MPVLHDILSTLPPVEHPVTDVCAGTFWTAVTVEQTGLSTTLRETDCESSRLDHTGEMTTLPPLELAAYILQDNTLAASIGMATVNALLPPPPPDSCQDINAVELLLEKGSGGNIGVIGHFPFLPRLRKAAAHVWVFEKRPRPGDLPASEAPNYLPDCDVVCLSGTTLLNHTFEELVALCRDRYVILTGGSSPLSPVLFDYGVDVICGVQVDDAEPVCRCVAEGGSFRQIKKHGLRLVAWSASIP